MASPDPVEAVRAFNRFHTRLVGALNEHLLASDYSLPQLRVLYEIAQAPPGASPSARALGQRLRLDTGYLSRLLGTLERNGLISRKPAGDNARRQPLLLTPRGRQLFGRLDQRSAAEVQALLAPLPAHDRHALVGAMIRIRRLLGDFPAEPTFTLRDPVPGDLGWIVHRQARLYADEYGWDWTFEALLAEIASHFIQHFQPGRERCWVAEGDDGEIAGAVFVVRQDDTTAKLRMLYVEPAARGHGLGRRLVDECLRFAQAQGYRRMVLWTNEVLVAARRIYETAGFRQIERNEHHSFGKDLIGEVWERDLQP